MPTITPELQGVDDWESLLAQIQSHMSNMSPLMKTIAETMAQNAKNRIDQQITPMGTPFHPHSPGYVNRTGKILIDTGALQNEIQPQWTTNSASVIAGTGSSASYAYRHQYGAGVPSRPFIGASAEDVEQCVELMIDYLNELV